MSRIAILVVEDEPEVREAIGRDLNAFAATFRIEFAEDAEDALEAMAECDASGDRVGLVLADHLLPGQRGTDFLIALNQDPVSAPIRKVLITGQAGHDDTIRAINEANLRHYIAKPWDPIDLQAVVRDQLTEWVLEQERDLLPYVAVLDGPRLLEAMRTRTWDR
jgi:two-component system chemotaxis response regulator CheY